MCIGVMSAANGFVRRSFPAPRSSETQQDFNPQRLIYKCRLDPSTDNSGYAGVVRVVRNGGSSVELVVTSFRKQDVTLIARHGIEDISAPEDVLAAPLQAGKADIDLHLPAGKPVSLHLKLGTHKPSEWVGQRKTV